MLMLYDQGRRGLKRLGISSFPTTANFRQRTYGCSKFKLSL